MVPLVQVVRNGFSDSSAKLRTFQYVRWPPWAEAPRPVRGVRRSRRRQGTPPRHCPQLRKPTGHGSVLVIVDQPTMIGSLPVTAAGRSMPHALRRVGGGDDDLITDLGEIVELDD